MFPQACLICGGERRAVIFSYDRPDDYEQAVGVGAEGYDRNWVACDGCGFRYSAYSRDPEVLDRIYEDGYRSTGSAWREEQTEALFERILALPPDQSETVQRIRWIKTEIKDLSAAGFFAASGRPARLLDVGGATGIFAYSFKDEDWAVEVVDPGNQGAFVEKHGVAYHQMCYGAAALPGAFDLISMIYMLEHVRDPDAVLAQARRDLTPGGLLYVEVPDAIAFSRKPAEDDIFNACHLWMFDPDSLSGLLSRRGFQVLALKRFQAKRGHFALVALAGLA